MRLTIDEGMIMRKTTLCVIGVLIIITSQFVLPVVVNGLTMPLLDEVDDVFQLQNFQPIARGDFHDELDIVQASIVNTSLVVTFQTTPVIVGGRTYGGHIYWWGAFSVFNYTSWRIGLDLMTYMLTNYVEIHIDFSTNGSSYDLRMYDVVTLEGNSLIFPILNHTLLPSFPNPPHFAFAAGLLEDDDLKFVDHLPEMFSWTPPTPTPTTPESTENTGFLNSWFISLVLSVLVVFIRRKRQKRK